MARSLAIGIALFIAGAFGQTVPQARPSVVVHIYRSRLSLGKTAHPAVSCDATEVARMQNGRVYTMKVSAGTHAFTTVDDPVGISIDVQPGKEYFVRIDYPANSTSALHASPVQVAPELGSQEIRNLRPLDGWFVKTGACGI